MRGGPPSGLESGLQPLDPVAEPIAQRVEGAPGLEDRHRLAPVDDLHARVELDRAAEGRHVPRPLLGAPRVGHRLVHGLVQVPREGVCAQGGARERLDQRVGARAVPRGPVRPAQVGADPGVVHEVPVALEEELPRLVDAHLGEHVAVVVGAALARQQVRDREHRARAAVLEEQQALLDLAQGRQDPLGGQLVVGQLVERALAVAHREHGPRVPGRHGLARVDPVLDQLPGHGHTLGVERIARLPVGVVEDAVEEHALRLAEEDRRGRELLPEAGGGHVDVREVRRVPALVEQGLGGAVSGADHPRDRVGRELNPRRAERPPLAPGDLGAVHEAVLVLARAVDEVQLEVRAPVIDPQGGEGAAPAAHGGAEQEVRVLGAGHVALGQVANVPGRDRAGPRAGRARLRPAERGRGCPGHAGGQLVHRLASAIAGLRLELVEEREHLGLGHALVAAHLPVVVVLGPLETPELIPLLEHVDEPVGEHVVLDPAQAVPGRAPQVALGLARDHLPELHAARLDEALGRVEVAQLHGPPCPGQGALGLDDLLGQLPGPLALDHVSREHALPTLERDAVLLARPFPRLGAHRAHALEPRGVLQEALELDLPLVELALGHVGVVRQAHVVGPERVLLGGVQADVGLVEVVEERADVIWHVSSRRGRRP